MQDSVLSRGIENIGKLLMYDQNSDDFTTNGDVDSAHSSPEKKTYVTNAVTKSSPVKERTNAIVEQKINANQKAHSTYFIHTFAMIH